MIPILYSIDYIKRNVVPGSHQPSQPLQKKHNSDQVSETKYINVPEVMTCAQLHNKALSICRNQKHNPTNMAE